MAESLNVKVEIPGREELEIGIELDDEGNIAESRLSGLGGPQLLLLLEEWRPKWRGPLKSVPEPSGVDPAAILMRELILRVKGEWKPPYEDDEVCHCRSVSLEVIDNAIICGAHSPELVSVQTSASTACGTCRPDVISLIDYRLGKS